MSLFNTEMDFKTIYRLDFAPKRGSAYGSLVIVYFHFSGLCQFINYCCYRFKYTPPTDSDPVSSPWHQYLVPDESLRHLLPADGVYEEPSCVLHRVDFELFHQYNFRLDVKTIIIRNIIKLTYRIS